jgi:cation diffusion facilitator CzcD-associated flavoprotein CzcO
LITARANPFPPAQACDVPAHGYSFSFELNPNWSTAFAPGHEIEEYIRCVAKKYMVYEHVTFNTEVVKQEYDETKCEWAVSYTTNGGPVQTTRSRVIFSCVGGLHVPQYPAAPGVRDGTFKGIEVHSAEWNINANTDLTNKDVVVIGSAASAVQIVPEIVDRCRSLTVLQRTPNWLAPQHGPQVPIGLTYGPIARFLLNNVPGLLRLYRFIVYWSMEVLHFPLELFRVSSIGQYLTRRVLTKFMMHLLKGNQEIAAKVIPTYPVGCKRIIRSERFLPALLKPHVKLVTSPLVKVEPDAVVCANGERIKSEVIVYATGFQVGSMGNMRVLGCGDKQYTGFDLIDSAEPHYLGICAASLPNSFTMLGPNTGLGHQSIIVMIETQVNFAVGVVSMMADKQLCEVRVKPDIAKHFFDVIQEGVKGTVWTSNLCHSWYQNKHGELTTLWPFTTVRYMREASPPSNLDNFHCKPLSGQPLHGKL